MKEATLELRETDILVRYRRTQQPPITGGLTGDAVSQLPGYIKLVRRGQDVHPVLHPAHA